MEGLAGYHLHEVATGSFLSISQPSGGFLRFGTAVAVGERMRKGIWLLATVLCSACSDMTDVAGVPTGPSAIVLALTPTATAAVAQHLPTLTGRWRASGTTAFRNLSTGNTLNYGGCSGSLTVTSQDGEHFIGALGTQGGGYNSDRFCTASGTFNGELDGAGAKARLDGNFQNWPSPAVSPSCEVISAGDGIWTGSASSDAIQLQVRDTLRCAASVDGSMSGTPMADFERTVSLTFERW
jgi:hypothetical protein